MSKTLFVNACIRPESRSHRLALKVLEKIGGDVSEVNLPAEKLPPLDLEALNSRNAYIASGELTAPIFKYAHQFAEADDIVIATPYWDLAFPSMLRIYLEHVTVTGVTFAYSPEGIPFGMCKAGRIIYVTTAGGPIGNFNFGYDYVKALADTFYGIPQTLCFTAENLDIVGNDPEAILMEACKRISNSNL
jgi:FMN-dependent NADH-azoreductase